MLMTIEDVKVEVHHFCQETGGVPVLCGFYQEELLRDAANHGFDPFAMRVAATRKIPRLDGGASMLTFVFRNADLRRRFMERPNCSVDRWYYYSQPPPSRSDKLHIRPYLDLDAEDSKSEEGFGELERFAQNELWPALCDFCNVPPDKRDSIISTRHKSRDGKYAGSVHITAVDFAFESIWHYARCLRAFLRSVAGTPLIKNSWRLYGAETSKNAQGHGVIDTAPVGREDGTGWHKLEETFRKRPPGLDVYDFDIMDVDPSRAYIVRKMRKPSVSCVRRCSTPSVSLASSMSSNSDSAPVSPQMDAMWYKSPLFANTAIVRMAPRLLELTGSALHEIKLVPLPYKTRNPDGAEYRVHFRSKRGFTNKCPLSNKVHRSNNIKIFVRLHEGAPRMYLGCHSTKLPACNCWRTVYAENMSPLAPPAEYTDAVPRSVVEGNGTHIELAVWTREPFRMRVPGYKDITNKDASFEYEEISPLPMLVNDEGSYLGEQTKKKLDSGSVRDLCFRLVPESPPSTADSSDHPPHKKQRT